MVESENQSAQTGLQRVDFVIVTALEEERDAVLSKLPGYKLLDPIPDDIRTYYSADVDFAFPSGMKGTYHVIVMPLLDMGRVQATAATNDAIHRWHPRYVILVGIAGGIARKGVHLGDILIANQIVDYELQKLKRNKTKRRFETYRVDPRLLGAIENCKKACYSITSAVRPNKTVHQCHIGIILSGDKVIADVNILNEYSQVWDKLVGVEMEAGGVACSSFQASEATHFFMIRGVSDLGDSQKDSPEVKKWRQYACDVAASCMISILRSGPISLEVNDNSKIQHDEKATGSIKRQDETDDRPLITRDVSGKTPDEIIRELSEWKVIHSNTQSLMTDLQVCSKFLNAYRAEKRNVYALEQAGFKWQSFVRQFEAVFDRWCQQSIDTSEFDVLRAQRTDFLKTTRTLMGPDIHKEDQMKAVVGLIDVLETSLWRLLTAADKSIEVRIEVLKSRPISRESDS